MNKIGRSGFLIDNFLIDNPPDMQGGMRHFAIEKDGGKAGNVMPVAEELGMGGNLMFHPDDLKQPEEKEVKVPVDEPDAEIALQIDYLQRQHEEHMELQFESSEDAENNFNDELAKINNIERYGRGKFLTQYKRDDPMYFVPRAADNADGVKQMLNSIADEGSEAEDKMEADIKADEEAEAEAQKEKDKAAVQVADESSVILGGMIAEGDSAEAALNAPAAPAQPVQKAAEAKKKQDEDIDFDASDVQIRFVELATPKPAPHYKGLSQVKQGDVAGTYLNGLLNDGAMAEQNIQDMTPEGAVAKKARDAAYAKKLAQEEDGQFYDDSEVQLRFIGQNDDNVNDELAKYNKIDKLGSKGFLIEGEIAQRNFTYFPQHKQAWGFEGADEVRQFLNLVKDDGDDAEEAGEAASEEKAEPAAPAEA